jgi:hypothetical protein
MEGRGGEGQRDGRKGGGILRGDGGGVYQTFPLLHGGHLLLLTSRY